MANTKKAIEEARAVEYRLYCHTLRLKHYSFAEIAVLAREKFDRPFSLKAVAAYCEAELSERIALDEHVVSRMRFAAVEELDGLARVLQGLLLPTVAVVDDVEILVPPAPATVLGMVREYRGLIQDRAKLLGLNSAEKVDATVTVVTPQDPAVLALIAEAEAITGRPNQ